MPYRSEISFRKILYIEDDEGLARLLQKRMERFGFTVDIAVNGEEGLERLKANEYDVLLVDYYLPGMSGLEILTHVTDSGIEAPVIMLTALGDEKLALEALTRGAADYMVKDTNNAYFDLLPAVMSAAYTRVRLIRQNREQQQELVHYARKLKESEDRLHLALQSSSTGAWDWDIKTDELYWSPNLSRMFGLPEGQKPSIAYWESRIHPDDRENVRQRVDDCLKGTEPDYYAIYREMTEDGGWRWGLSRGTLIRDEQGQPLRMLGTHTDFTEQMRLQEQLIEEKQRAEQASRAKSEFLATMSHEIRTPMNAIIGFSGLLATTSLDERQRDMVETLKSSSENLMALINDLLDISRIEAGHMTLEKTPFSLAAILHDIDSMLAIQARKKGIEFVADTEAVENIHFLGDSTRIRQILINLCGNALKFTDHGSVNITTSRTPRGDGTHTVEIAVRDTGIGISPEKMPTIFDKFVQADQSITRRYGGSGLGLSISQTLAEMMDGNIRVESNKGEGSLFTLRLTLPETLEQLPATAQQVLQMEPEQKSEHASETVLLVEDYEANIIVATLLLESMGYACEVARNGHAALEAIHAGKRYLAILMDVQMHDMDGLETTRRIRVWEQQQGVVPQVIIGATAHALAGDRERCINAGMNDYLAKPLNVVMLSEKLQKLSQARHAA